MRNYFKVAAALVFFNSSKVHDTQVAFEQAMAKAGNDINQISVFELPDNPGPWDRCGIVGHRRRGEILADINSEKNAVELEYRQDELERLDRQYYSAGRDIIPLFEVAA